MHTTASTRIGSVCSRFIAAVALLAATTTSAAAQTWPNCPLVQPQDEEEALAIQAALLKHVCPVRQEDGRVSAVGTGPADYVPAEPDETLNPSAGDTANDNSMPGDDSQPANAASCSALACGGALNGSISLTQRLTSVSPGYDAGETTVVDIKLDSGRASAHVVDNKHETTDTPAANGGCASFRHNTGSAVGDVQAGVNLSSPSESEYQIVISVPDDSIQPVTGTWDIETLNVGGCTAGRVSRAEQYPVNVKYTVTGQLDPGDPKHLKGTLDDTRSLVKTTVNWDLNLQGN
jgi:hypothetical protein